MPLNFMSQISREPLWSQNTLTATLGRLAQPAELGARSRLLRLESLAGGPLNVPGRLREGFYCSEGFAHYHVANPSTQYILTVKRVIHAKHESAVTLISEEVPASRGRALAGTFGSGRLSAPSPSQPRASATR